MTAPNSMTEDSTFSFGKYKGMSIKQVATSDFGYLSWLKQTGFNGFASDIFAAVGIWEETHPKELKRIQKSVAAMKAKGQAVPDPKPVEAPKSPVSAPAMLEDPAWGTW